jgi:hypothetical protein
MKNKCCKSMDHDSVEKSKIKVSEAEIVVHGTIEKPYYEIKYCDISNNEVHIGYSSYNLKNVFNWLREYFEIIK